MGGTRILRARTAWAAVAAAFLFSSLFASPARAQFWNKKTYQHWSARECRKILTDSPWTKSRTYSAMEMPSGTQDSAVPGRQPMLMIRYTAQFFSAQPVRQAEVRLSQIREHFDRMTPAQKKAFEQQAAHFLSVPFAKFTLVRVNYTTNVEYFRSSLLAYWRAQTTAQLRNSAYLMVNGRTVRLLRYEPAPAPQHAFFLFFPRQVNGEPLLNASQKSLTLQVTKSTIQFNNDFGSGAITAQPPPTGSIQFQFDVRKMLFHDQVAY